MHAYTGYCPEKILDFVPTDKLSLSLRLPRQLPEKELAEAIALIKKHKIEAIISSSTAKLRKCAQQTSQSLILHSRRAVPAILSRLSKKISGLWHDDPSNGPRIGNLAAAEIAWQEVAEYMHSKRKLDYLVTFDTSESYRFDERLKRLSGWTGGIVLSAGMKGGLPALECVERASELVIDPSLFICSGLEDVGPYLPYIEGVIIDLSRFQWDASAVGKYVSDLRHEAAALSW